MTENDDAEVIAAAGTDAMTHAHLIFEAESVGKLTFREGSSDARKRFEFARQALAQAEETLQFNPDAVFMYGRSELFLSEAVKHLRRTIERAEEIYKA